MAGELIMTGKNTIKPKVIGFVDDFSNFSVVTGGNSDLLPRLVDGNPDVQYISTGIDSDASFLEIVFEFFDGPNAVDRKFSDVGGDLVLLNHNLKHYFIDYWNPGTEAWVNALTISGNASADTYDSFSFSVESPKIRLRADETIVADEEKEIGEIYVCDRKLQFADDLNENNPSEFDIGNQYRLARTDLIKITIGDKYRASFMQKYVPRAERDLQKAIYDAHESFIVLPEPDLYPRDIYLVHWVGGWNEKYSTLYKGAGYTIGINVEEV